MIHFPLSFYSNRTSASVNEHHNTIFSKNCSQMPLLKNIKLIRLPDFISCVYLYYSMYTKIDKIKYHEKQKIIIELKIKSSRCLFY